MVRGYAAKHKLGEAARSGLNGLLYRGYRTPTSRWWTIASKPAAHSVYNYGLTVEEALEVLEAYGPPPEAFVQWVRENTLRLRHLLFDMSVDFVAEETGIRVVRAAIGGAM